MVERVRKRRRRKESDGEGGGGGGGEVGGHKASAWWGCMGVVGRGEGSGG